MRIGCMVASSLSLSSLFYSPHMAWRMAPITPLAQRGWEHRTGRVMPCHSFMPTRAFGA